VPIPADFIDVVRCEAYPIDSDRGADRERIAVRKMLGAIASIRGDRELTCGAAVEAIRGEVWGVFLACMRASGL
jgi:hypothetical protein